jgi:hypothetical protein
MDLAVRMEARTGARVMAHLRSRPEMVAFMRGALEGPCIVVGEELLLSSEDVELDRWHVALSDESRQAVLRWATGAEALVEVHSHGSLGGAAMFSATDLNGLDDWVPHVRWRVPGVTYAALVFGAESFDGLIWRVDAEEPTVVGNVVVDAEATWRTSALSIDRWRMRHLDD